MNKFYFLILIILISPKNLYCTFKMLYKLFKNK